MGDGVVRLGFVGTGGRAQAEMAELVRMPDVVLAAFCDVVPERCAEALASVRRLRAELGLAPVEVPCFTDVRAMLAAVDLDGVYVSLPPYAHGQPEHAILDAGKALFVEKPVALEPAVAREILAHARETDVVTCVGYQLRYSDTVARARELLAGRTVGLAIATRFGGVPPAPWWRVQAKSGGMLIEMHTHAVDLLRFLCGEVRTAYAEADTRLLVGVPGLEGLDIPDVEAATLRFVSGAVGVLADSCALVGGLRFPGAGGIWILAQGLGLVLGGERPAAYFPEGRSEALPPAGPCDRRLNEAFVHALRTGDRSRILSDYADGLATLEVTWACRCAAQQGRVVRVTGA